MNLIQIDKDKCQRDRICGLECPGKLIEFRGKGAFPSTIENAAEFCIRCGHCVAVCPNGALTLENISSEQLLRLDKNLLPGPEQVRHMLISRRSIRTYKNKIVKREILEDLIGIAQYAPTGSNKQQVYWLVIEDSAESKRLAGLVVDWMKLLLEQTQDEALSRRYQRIIKAWDNGVDRICRQAPHVIVAHAPENIPAAGTDCVIALSYLELAAYSQGLGTCWAGYFNSAANFYPPMQKALNLPEGHRSCGALLIGYPVYGYQRIPTRNAAQIIWR